MIWTEKTFLGVLEMKVGILGYGNLGRGVESAIRQNDDMELTCIITRRDSLIPLLNQC